MIATSPSCCFLLGGVVPMKQDDPGDPFLSRSLRSPVGGTPARGETQVMSAFSHHLKRGAQSLSGRGHMWLSRD